MKVYVVNQLMRLRTIKLSVRYFWIKKEAEGYKKAKEEEYPIRWGGEYNHCEIFKKHL